MRHPRKSVTSSALIAIVDALPDDRLRPLLVQLLRAGADADVLAAPVGDPPPARRPRRLYKRRRTGSRPPGRKRRGPGRPRKAVDTDDPKIVARRAREAQRIRKKRAAAKETVAEQATAETSNGNGGARPKITPAQFWEHAARISPKTPWRAVAREPAARNHGERNRAIP